MSLRRGGQAQPFRRRAGRPPSAALSASMAGKPKFTQNPAVLRGQLMKRAAERRRKLRARRRGLRRA